MNSDLIKIWLKRNKSRLVIKKCSSAIFSLFSGIIVLIVTFWLTYFVAWLASSGFLSLIELVMGAKYKVGSIWLLIVSGIFIIMLFVQYLRTDAWNFGRYKHEEFNVDPRLRSDINELVPAATIIERSGIMAKLFADVLVIGPRLVLGAWVRVRELSEIRRIEIDHCAAALAFVCSQTDAVTYEKLCEAGWGEQLGQLKNIEGVRFLKNGVLLSEDLKAEFNNLR